jgi:hypothetical protein
MKRLSALFRVIRQVCFFRTQAIFQGIHREALDDEIPDEESDER